MPQQDRKGLGKLAPAALVVAAALLATLALTPAPGGAMAAGRPMPDFPHQRADAWINSPPLSRADLTGQVVLIEIWTSV